jgi:hypothetical protein
VQELWDSAIATLTDPIDQRFVREFQQSTLAKPVPQAFFEVVSAITRSYQCCEDRMTLARDCSPVISKVRVCKGQDV